MVVLVVLVHDAFSLHLTRDFVTPFFLFLSLPLKSWLWVNVDVMRDSLQGRLCLGGCCPRWCKGIVG